MAAKGKHHPTSKTKHTKTTKGGGAGSTQQGSTAAQAAAKAGKVNHLVHQKNKTSTGHKKTKAAKGVKASKTTKAKTHYTAAQRKAYQSASKAAIHRAQLQHNAKALEERRLQAALKVLRKLQIKRAQAVQARIAAHAVRATYLQTAYGHEARPLQIAAAHRLFKAQSVATNRQFAAAGEAIHARTTVMQTLTDAQALSAEQRLSAKARASYLRRKKLRTKKGKVIIKGKIAATRKAKTSRHGKSPYAAIGARAGRQAAAKLPGPSKRRGAPKNEPVESPSWITAGNDDSAENCVAVAIANSCLHKLGYRVTDEQVEMVRHDRLNKALWMLWKTTRWWPIDLIGYHPQCPALAQPGDVIGFETDLGPHCGILMPNDMVVSWGEIVPLESPIDEAWSLTWRITG